MPATIDDAIETILDDLWVESPACKPSPAAPLQNALPETRTAVSVIVAATNC